MARWLALAIAIVAVGVLVLALRSGGPAPSVDPEPELPTASTAESAAEPAAPSAPKGMVLLIPESEPEVAEDGPISERTLRLPVVAKLADRPLSEVEHRLVGAWDDDPESADPGAHRTFVAVVDPDLSSRELESLLRDIADRQRGAEVLDVRIYDSEHAATSLPSRDGGRARLDHLVARIVRNDRLGYEEMTVRGQSLVP